MFNNISWQSYWSAVFLLVIGYYVLIGFIYYRGEWKNWFFGTHASEEFTTAKNDVET